MQDKLRFVLKTGLFRVPKKIKRTPVYEFVKEHGDLPDVRQQITVSQNCGGIDENEQHGAPATVVKGIQGNEKELLTFNAI
jgi:hypothetical protein